MEQENNSVKASMQELHEHTMDMENIIGIAQAAIVIAIGFWLVAHVFMAVGGAAEEDAIDPNRKSAKRAQKQKSKHDAQERKGQERQAKL